MGKSIKEFDKRSLKYRAYLRAKEDIKKVRISHRYNGKNMPIRHWNYLKIELARQLIISMSEEEKNELMESLERKDWKRIPRNFEDFCKIRKYIYELWDEETQSWKNEGE